MQLLQLEAHPELSDMLLFLLTSSEAPTAIQLAAVLYLKNYIKKIYSAGEDSATDSVLDTGRQAVIKNKLVECMLTTPTQIQVHISDIISIISATDFPHRWEDLLPVAMPCA